MNRRNRVLAVLAAVVVILVVVLVVSSGGSKKSSSSPTSAAPTESSSTTTVGSTEPATTTTLAATTEAPTTEATTTAAPTTTIPPLRVASVSASVSPDLACTEVDMTLRFRAVIRFDLPHQAGTIRFHWTRSDGATGASSTVNIAADRATYTVTSDWMLGAPMSEMTVWERVNVTSPNSVVSNRARVAYTNAICAAN